MSSAISVSLTTSGFTPLKMSAESPERRATLSASIRPRYDAVIVAGDDGNHRF